MQAGLSERQLALRLAARRDWQDDLVVTKAAC